LLVDALYYAITDFDCQNSSGVRMSTVSWTRGSAWHGMGVIAMATIMWGTIGVAVSVLYRVTPTNVLSVSFLRLAIWALVLLLLNHRLGACPYRAGIGHVGG
jgi:uncharacterized membrane protein YwaF